MAKTILIRTGALELEAALDDSRTAGAIWEALPITARINTWGDEIYFSIPVKLELEAGREVVEAGELGYWPPGSAFCIFYGRTPASTGNEVRAASAVSVFGRVRGDATVLRGAVSGAPITVERKTK